MKIKSLVKAILLFPLVTIFMATSVSAFEATDTAFSTTEFECEVYPRGQGRCSEYRGMKHYCDLPKTDVIQSKGMFLTSEFCTNTCADMSAIPEDCRFALVVRLRDSTENSPEELVQEVEVITEDDSDLADDEFFEMIDAFVAAIKNIFGDAKESAIFSRNDENSSVDDNEGSGTSSSDEASEEFEEFDVDEEVGFNKFKIIEWPNNTEVAKFVDPYGIEKFTSDGKHFYDTPYEAAHSQEGVSNIINNVSDSWGDFKDYFFKTKLKDDDKELQREIAREVLSDAKTTKEKDIEKAYEKIGEKINVPKGGDIPAAVIIMVAQEAKETDFAAGALIYIEERKKGNSPSVVRDNNSELLSEGYGTFGQGVSLSTTNKQAPAVLYARYEETYQRYLLAKKLNRKN